MGAKLSSGGGPVADLNLTPMIDIVLVVLIIMMVNMPIKISELDVKLPSVQNDTPKTDTPPDQLVIAIYKDGSAALNLQRMTDDRMLGELTNRLRPLAKKNVFIDAHPEVEYGRVIDYIDLGKASGAAQVGLARLKPTGPRPSTSVAEGAMARGVYPASPRIATQGEAPLDEKTADQALKLIMPNVKACYFTALASNPTLTGHIIFRTTAGPDGQAMEEPSISDATSIEDEALLECVSALFPAITYPPQGEGNTAAIQYQLLFSPG